MSVCLFVYVYLSMYVCLCVCGGGGGGSTKNKERVRSNVYRGVVRRLETVRLVERKGYQLGSRKKVMDACSVYFDIEN